MNGFKKLVLCTAMIAASGSAMAMQAMDEESMSSTTGQDGLTITINSSDIQDLGITWIDRDGRTTGDGAGAVTIDNIGVTISNLVITVDAGSAAANSGQVLVGISTADDVTVHLNDRGATPAGAVIGVGAAGATAVSGTSTPILKFADNAQMVISGGFSADIKLGNRNAATEHFMTMDFGGGATATNLTLTGLSIIDTVGTAANAGADVGIGIGTLSINDIVVHSEIDVVAGGLQINTAGTSIGSVAIEGVVLGDLATNASIGDIYLTGLTSNSIITIAGH
ncbi:MAG: DUF6160 family protein [Pseudomonadota bacterium]